LRRTGNDDQNRKTAAGDALDAMGRADHIAAGRKIRRLATLGEEIAG
jgi:hypothetical protein